MTKNEKTALYIVGGLVLLGGAGTAIYFATRPKPLETAEKSAVKGAIEGGLKTESAPVDASKPEELTEADKLQQAQNQQVQLPPQIQLPQNINQI